MELLPLIVAFVSRSRPRNRGWEEAAALQCSNPGMISTPPPHDGLVRIRRTGERHEGNAFRARHQLVLWGRVGRSTANRRDFDRALRFPAIGRFLASFWEEMGRGPILSIKSSMAGTSGICDIRICLSASRELESSRRPSWSRAPQIPPGVNSECWAIMGN